RLARAGYRYHILSHPETGRTHGSVRRCLRRSDRPSTRRVRMEPIVERTCGLDVHQATVVACLLVGQAHEKPKKEVRTFSTFTQELVKLRDWLQSEGCTHVGMESTGVYWKPVYAILEDAFEIIVGNAHHIKNVP